MSKRGLVLFLPLLLWGCAAGPANPPKSWEATLFSIQTNLVAQVKLVTNVVTVTNTVPVVTEHTNYIVQAFPPLPPMQVARYVTNRVTETVTNRVTETVTKTNLVLETNLVPSYVYTPNANAGTVVDTVGAVSGLVAPGSGAMVIAMLGVLFGAWGHMRSSKATATAAVLAQVIETGSELMKTTPQGQALESKWKTWMIQHQAASGVIQQVAKIVANTVDTPDAQAVAAKLTQ